MYPQNQQYRYSNNYQAQQSNRQQAPLYYMEESNLSFKADRRVWNKSSQSDINLDYPDPVKIAANLKRYDDYLFNLQINNKIQKITSQKSEKEEKLEKLETGFKLYVNGAHQKPERYTPRHTTITKSSSTSSASNDAKRIFTPHRGTTRSQRLESENLKQLEMLVKAGKEKAVKKTPEGRKKWSRCSFILKTEDGYEIKINAPKPPHHHVSSSPAHKKETREVKSADNVVRKNMRKKKLESNDYYSDDFESDDDDDSDNKDRETENKTTTSCSDKNLIETVHFSNSDESSTDSEESIVEEIDNDNETKINNDNNKKKLTLNLNKNDIKALRESINIFDSINEITGKKSEFKSTFENVDAKAKDDSISEIEEEELCEDENKSSSICDIIIKQISHLNLKERSNLVDFLNKIDSSAAKNK